LTDRGDLIVCAANQLDCLRVIIDAVSPERLAYHSAPNRWSALENLAHLARYQRVFLDERCSRILQEDQPILSRYRAEDDPEWHFWQRLPPAQIVESLMTERSRLLELLGSLSETEWGRVGHHPAFGALNLRQWVQFFLTHEAHHLYVALVRSRD